MRALDFLVRYDRRRERYRVTAIGWVTVALAAALGLAAAVALVRAARHPLSAAAGTTVPAPLSVPAPTLLPATGTPAARPDTWQVWAETVGEGTVFHAPDDVTAMVIADFRATADWWQANQRAPDVLEAGLAARYSGPMLEQVRQAVERIRQDGKVRLIFHQDAPPEGRPEVEVTSFSQDGRTAYLTHLQGASHNAEYALDDGALVPGSQQVLPPIQATYRLVFDASSRSWTIDALMFAGALK